MEKKVERNDPCPCGSGKKYKRCCYPKESQITPVLMKNVKLTIDDGFKTELFVPSVDSVPRHNYEGLRLSIPKEELISLCIERIHTILQAEKVGSLADLTNQVMEELNIVPNFTYREIGQETANDDRFETFQQQIYSLKGTDPIELLIEKLEKKGL